MTASMKTSIAAECSMVFGRKWRALDEVAFNHRFAQPSRDGHPFVNVFYPVDVPYFDEEHLMEKSHRAKVVPKLFLINGAYEYWGRAASLIHTTADGKADAPPSPNTRIYFFAGSQHGPGTIPPRTVPAQNEANVNDYRYGLRALLLDMQNWLEAGTEPPASVFPKIRDGQLTTMDHLHFPAVPGVHVPAHKREAYRLDFSVEPPKTGAPLSYFGAAGRCRRERSGRHKDARNRGAVGVVYGLELARSQDWGGRGDVHLYRFHHSVYLDEGHPAKEW